MSGARAELTKRKPRPKKSSEAFHFLDREAKLSEDEFHDGVSSDESGSSEPAAYDASFVDDCTQRVNNDHNIVQFCCDIRQLSGVYVNLPFIIITNDLS